MKPRLFLLVLLAACASGREELREFPVNQAPAPEVALVAGKYAFHETRFRPTLDLRAEEGTSYRVELEGEVFLVALPPGRYSLTQFGTYEPIAGDPMFEVRAGAATYIGSFEPLYDPGKGPRVVVQDSPRHVERVLTTRYGSFLDRLEPGLATTAASKPGEDLVMVVRESSSQPTVTIGVGGSSGGIYYSSRYPHAGGGVGGSVGTSSR